MAKEFECERDGLVIPGAGDDELAANVERPIAEAHPDLIGKVCREDILAAAREGVPMRSGDETTANDGLVLRVKRILPAPRAAVYAAFSARGELAKWWGPRGFTAPSIDFDPRVGDSYRIAMQPPDGDLFYLSGEFREVDPPARLTFTFRWDPPSPDDRQTVATLLLRAGDDRTEVLLTQRGFATEERLELHEQGWAESFERLEELLAPSVGIGPGSPDTRALRHP